MYWRITLHYSSFTLAHLMKTRPRFTVNSLLISWKLTCNCIWCVLVKVYQFLWCVCVCVCVTCKCICELAVCTEAYMPVSGSLLQWIRVSAGDGGPLSSICWTVTSPPNHLASDSMRLQLGSRSILMLRTRRLLQGAIVQGANLCVFQGTQHKAPQTSQHG